MFSQHKAGKLKQVNKKHKNGGSKRAIKRAFGAGRVEGAAGNGKKGAVAADLAKNSRLNRANHSQQIMKSKRDQLWLQKRIGSSSGPPKVVALIPLSYSAKPYNCLATLISEASWSSITSAELQEQMKTGVVPMVHTQYNQFKARFSFIQAKMDIISALDAAKVADIVVFLVDGKSLNDGRSELITPVGMSCISALRAQGCPEVVACVQGMESFTGKALIDRRKLIHRTLESSISSDVKIVETAATQLCRQLFSASIRDIGWRSIRTYLVADSVAVSSVQAVDTSNGPVSRLRIGGYLRGRPLHVNSLVHITGLGTGRIASIVCDPSAQPGNTGRNRNGISSMTLTADTAQQEPLVLEAAADGISGEQTWPTEEEMNTGDISHAGGGDVAAGRNRRNVPSHIPEGMSSYQADWFLDEEGHFDDREAAGEEGDDDDDENNGEEGDDMEEANQDAAPPAAVAGGGGAKATAAAAEEGDGDMEEDDLDLGGSLLHEQTGSAAIAEKKRIRAMAKEDAEFPDEMDTPVDVSARQRFARFRALQSFRSSPWHPKENLPVDYSRIYQFENFGATQRRILAEGKMLDERQSVQQLSSAKPSKGKDDSSAATASAMAVDDDDNGSVKSAAGNPFVVADTEDVVCSAQYVIIEIDCVPHADQAVAKFSQQGYLSVFSLLQHENKLSVLHFTVMRTAGYEEPIRSKDELIFQVGCRTFTSRPLFSESNLNCDKHKMERFWAEGRFTVATTFGPITFHPSPVLVFKRLTDGSTVLVGSGTLMSVDPDRIILKKVILTGHPIRVRKKFAVVKHMFYDPQDVRWFKPAELTTKHGLRGHIKEPVGTHGLYKAHFSAGINQNDTVMLTLYKRVFPKLPPATGRIEVV